MTILAFILGAVLGSFLSVCIYRIPYSRSVGLYLDAEGREQELDDAGNPPTPAVELSVSSPKRSFCPKCKAQLMWWHNIPLVSWLVLRGRCSSCKAAISIRYPTVELMSGCVAWLSYESFGLTLAALVVYLICAALIVISFIDYDYYIIPNCITYPGTVLGVAFAAANQYLHILPAPFAHDLTSSVMGILAGAGFLWIVAKLYLVVRKQEGLGLGDVKLLAVTGAFFGVPGAIFTIFVGSVLGTVIGSAWILVNRKGMAHPLPFGPYLALANALYIFLALNPEFLFVPGLFPFGVQ